MKQIEFERNSLQIHFLKLIEQMEKLEKPPGASNDAEGLRSLLDRCTEVGVAVHL